MARHADGTIVINTAIETDGFKKGSKDMEAAFRKAAHNLEGVSEKIQISIEKSVQAFEKQNAAYREQEARVESLKAKIEEAQSEKVESQAFTDINKQIDDYQKKLDAAIEREIRFMETGGSTRSTAYERMEYDIEMLREKIAEAKAEKDRLLQSGEAYTGADISGLTSQLTEAQDKLGQMGGKLEASYASLRQKMDEYSEKAEESAKKTNIFKSAMDRLNSSARSSGSGIGGALKKFIKYGLGMATVYMLFNKLRAAIKDGIKNIVQFDKKTNTSISGIQSAFAKLKNNLTAAIAPLINALAPYIIKVVDWLNQAINKVAQFIAAMTGQTTYTKAKDVWNDYAQSLIDTSNAAKKAKQNLSGLDEIKTWDSGNDSTTISKISDMFEIVEVEDKFKDISWRDFGEMIGEGLNNFLQDASNWIDNIDWNAIWNHLKEGFDGFLKGLFKGTHLGNVIDIGDVRSNTDLQKDYIDAYQKAIPKQTTLLFDPKTAKYTLEEINALLKKSDNFKFKKLRESGLVDVKTWIKIKNEVEDTGHSIGDVAKKYVDLSDTSVSWLNAYIGKESQFKLANRNIIAEYENAVEMAKKALDELTNKGKGFVDDQIELNRRAAEITTNTVNDVLNKNKEILSKVVENAKAGGQEAGRSYAEGFELELRNGKLSIIKAGETIIDDIRENSKNLISQLVTIFGKQALERANQKAAKAAGEAIGDALGNGIISSVNQTNAHVADYTEFLIGQLEDSMKPGEDYYKKKAAIRKLKSFTVPYLASGAVIPPNAPFTAVLGDQKHGTNVEAPLETIKQALREVLGSGTGGGNTYNITATANGKTLFQLLLEEGRNAQMQTGKNPFLLA